MKALPILFACSLLAAPALAQSPAKLKAELRTKEAAAKQDPAALFEAAQWAKDKGLAMEARRIFQAILKLKPDHEGANLALGNELVNGKWMPANEAEAARKQAMEAEFKAKGLIEVDGVYVEPAEVDDAKKGIYHSNGEIVSKAEKVAMLGGMVRHPVTGMLIPAADLDKAKQGLFPVGSDRWVDAKEANRIHQDSSRPWLFRTTYYTLISTLPVETLDQVKLSVDQGYETVIKFFGGSQPTPQHRPIVFVAATRDEYTSMGTSMGDETSAYGAFLAPKEVEAQVPFQDRVRPAVCNWAEKNWGKYYAMHAAGLALISSKLADIDGSAPLWFEHAFGAYASRFSNASVAGFFGELHAQKGGVKDLKAWFNSFTISGDMESKEIDYNIYQAGLMLSFATGGADPKVTEAMLAISRCFVEGNGKDLAQDIDKLEKLLVAKEAAIRTYLQQLVANKDR